MTHFKQIAPTGPFDDDGRLDVKVDPETGLVELRLGDSTIGMTEHQARRFSVAFWAACNEAEVINHNLKRRAGRR